MRVMRGAAAVYVYALGKVYCSVPHRMATSTTPAVWGGVYVVTDPSAAAAEVLSPDVPPKVTVQRPFMLLPKSVTSWSPVAGPLFDDRLLT